MTTNTIQPTIRPCHNRVLIELVKPTDNLIELPENVAGEAAYVIVRAVGPDVKCVVSGERVILHPNPNIMGLKGQEHLALIDASIIMAVEEVATVNPNN
jgi:hypothetical protein